MNNLPSINNLTSLCLLILLFGCKKEPCLNIAELDKYDVEAKEWYVNDSIGTQKISDKNGISQTLKVSSRNTYYSPNHVQDDCGNTYGWSYFSIQYNTSFSPLHFMVDINGSGLPKDGFYLKMTITNTNSVSSKTTSYDFVSKNSRENNATVVFNDQIQILNKAYNNVLKISFNETLSPNDVRTVFYAKGFGIIKFITENGNEFEVN